MRGPKNISEAIQNGINAWKASPFPENSILGRDLIRDHVVEFLSAKLIPNLFRAYFSLDEEHEEKKRSLLFQKLISSDMD